MGSRRRPRACPGVDVVVVGPRLALYTESGRRRILPPLVFGLGVLWHLIRHGAQYDTVHTNAFPYFSLLAAALLARRSGYRLVVDWFEVWTLSYWREYLGRWPGLVGHRSSAGARASASTRSASRACTPPGCARRG